MKFVKYFMWTPFNRFWRETVNPLLRRSTFLSYSTTISFNFCHSAVPTTLLNPLLTFGFASSFFLSKKSNIISI